MSQIFAKINWILKLCSLQAQGTTLPENEVWVKSLCKLTSGNFAKLLIFKQKYKILAA